MPPRPVARSPVRLPTTTITPGMTTLGTITLGMTTGTPRVEIPKRPRRTIMLATTIPSTAPTAATFSNWVKRNTKIAGSIFQIKDQELLTLVGASDKDEKGVQARLVAKIDGKEEKLLLIDHHHHH